jgi:NADH-quinone oxidoreductase subunit H
LFFGGWNGPVLPSWAWFMIKTLLGVFVLMWFRWTYPRLRVDQLMSFAWKFLLPLAFINIVLTGLGICIFKS